MNIKASVKYQFQDVKKYILSYYFIQLQIFVFFLILNRIFGSEVSYGGFEFVTLIFLFICGLNSFKQNFLMMMQNSVSRKSMFIGASIAFLSASIFMSVVDRVIANFGDLISSQINGFSFFSFYDSIYGSIQSINGVLYQFEGIIVMALMYASALAAGYFITILYYRMSKALKIIVSVGVPVTLFIILPLLDTMVFNGQIGTIITKMFNFTFGSPGAEPNPYNMLISCIIGIAAAYGFSWLLAKRAVDNG